MIYANIEHTVVNGDGFSRLATEFTPEQLALVAPYMPTPAELNAPILAALLALDAKSSRPMLEGDVARMQAILVEKAALRSQLI